MPSFGARSLSRLETCHQDLQRLFNVVIQRRDCTVLCGVRTKQEQDDAVAGGFSKVSWPNSKHNIKNDWELSHAIDVAPYFPDRPHVRWDDLKSFYLFVGYVKGVADDLGIRIRCGADWDSDGDTQDQTFHDLPHFELIP